MHPSSITKRALRITSLGALALIVLAASANSSFAQPNTTTLPQIAAGIPSYVILEPLPPPTPGPELMTVNIAGAVFLGAPFEVDMTDVNINGVLTLSDRILFDNSGPGNTALISFLSDDEFGNLPITNFAGTVFPVYGGPRVPDGIPFSVTVPMLDAGTNPYTLTATMLSDDENIASIPPNISDILTLSAVPTPEPSTVVLAGLGLAALAGLAYRRRAGARA